MATTTKTDSTPLKLTLDPALRQRLTTAPQQAINDIKRQLIPLLMAKADDKGNSSEWALSCRTEEARRLDGDCPWPFSAGAADATYLPHTTPVQRKALHKSAQIYLWNLLYNTFKDIDGVQYILTDLNYQCVNYAHRDELTGEPTPIGTLLWAAIEQHYMSRDSFETLNYVSSYRAMLQSVGALKSFNPQHVQEFYDWIHQCTMTENIVKDLPDDTRCNSANFNDLKSHLTKLHTSIANRGHQGINFDYKAIYDDPRFNTEGEPDYMNIGAMLSELRSAIRKHAASTTDSRMKSVQVMNINSPDTCDYCGGQGHTRSNCKKLKAYKEALHVRKLHNRSGPFAFKRPYNKPNYNKFTFKRQQPNQLGNFLKPLAKFQGSQYQHKSPRFPNKPNKPYTEPYNKSAHYHQRRGTQPPYQPRRSVHFADQKRVPAFIAAPPRPPPPTLPPRPGVERAGFEAPMLPANDNLLQGATTTHHVFRVGVLEDDLRHKTPLSAPIGIKPTPSANGITPAPHADCDPIPDDEDDDTPPKKCLALCDANDKPITGKPQGNVQYIPYEQTQLPDGTYYQYTVGDRVEDPYMSGKKPTSGYAADNEPFDATTNPFDTSDDEHDPRLPANMVFGDPSPSDDDFDVNNDNKGNDDSADNSAADADNDPDPKHDNHDDSDPANDSTDQDDTDIDRHDEGPPSADDINTITIDDDIFESAKISHKICATANYISDLEERNKILEAEVNDHRELHTMFDTINQDAHKYILSLKTDVKHLEQNKIDLTADLASYQAEVRRLETCLINNNLQHLISRPSPSDSVSDPDIDEFWRTMLRHARTDPTILVAADASLPSPSDDISASNNSGNSSSAKSASSDYDSSGSL